MGVRFGIVVVAVVMVAGCSGGIDTTTDETLPLAQDGGRLVAPSDNPPDAEVEDLTRDQLTASTVLPPVLPELCDKADLELWTAQIVVGSASSDSVVRIRNTGDTWCEVDVRGSPQIDPVIEPDVWLDPGDWANLVVGQSGVECSEPELITIADIELNTEAVSVPTILVAACGWRLTALYAAETPSAECDESDLDLVLGDDMVVVKNSGPSACFIESPDGSTPMATGDIAVFGGDADVLVGPGRSYFDTIDSRSAELPESPSEIEQFLIELDPFVAGAASIG